MESIDTIQSNCQSEYDVLRKVIVCEPQFMAIDEIIAIKFLPLLDTDLDNKEKATLFYNYTLNKQMHENKAEGKRLKI